MKTAHLHCAADELETQITTLASMDPDIVLMFTGSAMIKDPVLRANIRHAAPHAALMGCSTAGEIGNGVREESVSLLALKFDTSNVHTASVTVAGATDSLSAGRRLANELMSDDLRGVFILSPGLNINGSQLTRGLRESLPPNISISGGLAGDGTSFNQTFTLLNDTVADNTVVAFGLYGGKARMHTGAGGGWKPFGPMRRVTKSTDNVLYELDGKPALALYKEYLGERASELPASGLLYPFAILDENKREAVGLIRTILNVSEADNSLTFAGDMPMGALVCLMHTTTDELAVSAEEATHIALGDIKPKEGDAVICVSCIGRKLLMGVDTEEEIDSVRAAANNLNVAGFYSYGEISKFEDSGQAALHNQTMTITYITE